jgi:hypothetical protein
MAWLTGVTAIGEKERPEEVVGGGVEGGDVCVVATLGSSVDGTPGEGVESLKGSSGLDGMAVEE